MDPILYISLAGIGVCLFLLLGGNMKPFRWAGSIFVRFIIGALALFFLNVFGSAVGYHLPINAFTVAVSGFLGVPGVVMLVTVDLFILS
ncbi:inhibitor of the pro-sigma K processing machinery [Alteribacillus persepolensis]|uniref:Inhibitor of the pro-sigma K processing machinery n=1 Tax=Alteribacillus persepolensis TaxID=568899 RepID=A0A1G8IX93_9BACI|nr:pro-sigmaK processing inhibitor BofA family protein [Alteribacillus persepolensis]SDI23337.1 inhibitor of the pro-sigma K processing machinery [Alteribacillus persepolensis]